MLNRAYSAIEVKALEADKRTFRGWATTPATDRVGDIVRPMGAKFAAEIPLLHQHNHDQPIGRVRFDKPTAKGIQFEARIPEIEEPGTLKDRVDTAWGEIKHGLISAVSIGFRPIKYAYKDDGGVDYQEVEIFELSAVTIPALPEAVITAVKSGHALSAGMVKMIRSFDIRDLSEGVPLLKIKDTIDLKGAIKLIAAS